MGFEEFIRMNEMVALGNIFLALLIMLSSSLKMMSYCGPYVLLQSLIPANIKICSVCADGSICFV